MTASTTLVGRINATLDLPGGYAVKRAALRAVLDVHRVVRMYDECGHHHEYEEDGSVPDGLLDLPELGLVCEEGYQFSLCVECCTNSEGGQSELCESDHSPLGTEVRMGADGRWHAVPPCWPCRTVRGIAEALGVQP